MEKIADIPKERIVYVDETGINSCLCREYGYAPKGKPVYDKIPGQKFRRINIIAAKSGKQIIAPMQYDCTINSTLFEFWYEQCLLPCIQKDSVIVMDNASFHRKKQLTEISEKHHRNLIFFLLILRS